MNIYLLSLVIVLSISNLYCLIKIAKLKKMSDFTDYQTKYIERLEENNLNMQIEMARTWEKNDKLQKENQKLQSYLSKKKKKIVELEKQLNESNFFTKERPEISIKEALKGVEKVEWVKNE